MSVKQIIRKLMQTWRGRISVGILAVLYGGALFAPFLAPYEVSDQDLRKTFHPPTALILKGNWPHVQVYEQIEPAVYTPVEGRAVPLKLFPKGFEYRALGLLPMRTHLFGVAKGERVYLLGSDSTGRDVFSRLLYGARISMSIGLVGVSITMFLGLVVGGLAGYFGGWIDNVAMRFTELLMAVPGLYLLLALRAALAERFPPGQMYLLIILILSFIGWAGTARVIRGLSLSLRQRPFILAAEVMGQSPWKILWKHILPNTFSYLIVAATLSVPGYILGEAALSFLGVGIQEPSASWGLMLTQAQQMKVFMLNLWWMLSPGLMIFLAVISFNVLGDALRDIVDPRMQNIRQ